MQRRIGPGRMALAAVSVTLLVLALAPGQPARAQATTTETFLFTGMAQTWVVPTGVTQATFDVYGAEGGNLYDLRRGRGGRATATLAVMPGATITIVVGGMGGSIGACQSQSAPGAGGFNGGGVGGSGSCEGAGGGGASDIRIGGTALANRVLVAGGGGGATNSICQLGGAGGGLVGLQGGGASCPGGTGGNEDGTSGSGMLGVGSAGADVGMTGGGGGGGGGGYYGGAGGADQRDGGGGSGFGPMGVVFETGVREGNGLITVTYTSPDTAPPSVSVTFTPNGQNGWFTTATASGTVSASDAMTGGGTISSLTCSGPGVSQGTATGIGAASASRPLSVTGEGSHAVSCSATDATGNTGSGSATVTIDPVAPTVARSIRADSCTVPGTNGWCRGTQTAAFTASDATSGLADPAQASFTRSSTTEGAMVTIPSGAVADRAGNSNPGVSAGPFKIDRTAPSFPTPPASQTVAATDPAGAAVTYTAAARDNLDATPAVACSKASGSTFAIGTTTVTCTATDHAGNQATASFSVTVRGAAAQLADLKTAVTGVGSGTSLADKAQAALSAAQAGDTATACGVLREFLNEVRAQNGKMLTAAQAQQFTADATRIRTVLGCR